MQWAAMQTAEYFHDVRRKLREMQKTHRSAVHVKMHTVERSIAEGVFARGDRRLAPAIEYAYRHGARFDGWDETFRYSLWLEAFAQTGVDPAWYAHRERKRDEILPWDHIADKMDKAFLWKQYEDLFAKIGVSGPGLVSMQE